MVWNYFLIKACSPRKKDPYVWMFPSKIKDKGNERKNMKYEMNLKKKKEAVFEILWLYYSMVYYLEHGISSTWLTREWARSAGLHSLPLYPSTTTTTSSNPISQSGGKRNTWQCSLSLSLVFKYCLTNWVKVFQFHFLLSSFLTCSQLVSGILSEWNWSRSGSHTINLL